MTMPMPSTKGQTDMITVAETKTETVAELVGRCDAEAWMAEFPNPDEWREYATQDASDYLLDTMSPKLVTWYLGVEDVVDADGDLAVDLRAAAQALHEYDTAWRRALRLAIERQKVN